MRDEGAVVKLALPKGSLQKSTAEFLKRAGFDMGDYKGDSRDYRPSCGIGGLQVKVLRPQEIPILVARGYYDLGISGYDWYLESDCLGNVKDAVDLGFGRVDVVLAVPATWDDVDSANSLFHRFRHGTHSSPLRIWTEYLNLTEQLVFEYLRAEPTIISPYARIRHDRHSSVQIFHSFGATESKPPEDGEAIVDNTETGRTLRANGLKIVHKVVPGSTAHLLVNKRALQSLEKQELVDLVVTRCERAGLGLTKQANVRFGGHMDW